MAKETLEEFIAAYGNPDKAYPVFEAGPEAGQWPTIMVKAGDKTAIVQFMNVGADGDGQHLCIDVHPFVAGRAARVSVFGMETSIKRAVNSGTIRLSEAAAWSADNDLAIEPIIKAVQTACHARPQWRRWFPDELFENTAGTNRDDPTS